MPKIDSTYIALIQDTASKMPDLSALASECVPATHNAQFYMGYASAAMTSMDLLAKDIPHHNAKLLMAAMEGAALLRIQRLQDGSAAEAYRQLCLDYDNLPRMIEIVKANKAIPQDEGHDFDLGVATGMVACIGLLDDLSLSPAERNRRLMILMIGATQYL